MKNLQASIVSGVAGAAGVTLLHEVTRKVAENPPRMDVLGMRALRKLGVSRRDDADPTLRQQALAGDLLSNSAYYAMVGAGAPGSSFWRGAALGAAAGMGAVTLPQPLGLAENPERTSTKLLTIGLYLAGGLIAAAVHRRLAPPDGHTSQQVTQLLLW